MSPICSNLRQPPLRYLHFCKSVLFCLLIYFWGFLKINYTAAATIMYLQQLLYFPKRKWVKWRNGGKRKESKSIVCGGNFLGYRETFHMWLSNPMNCKERGLKAHAYSSNLGLHLMREKGGKVRNDNEIHTLKILKTYLKLVDIRVRSYFHFCWKNYPWPLSCW